MKAGVLFIPMAKADPASTRRIVKPRLPKVPTITGHEFAECHDAQPRKVKKSTPNQNVFQR